MEQQYSRVSGGTLQELPEATTRQFTQIGGQGLDPDKEQAEPCQQAPDDFVDIHFVVIELGR